MPHFADLMLYMFLACFIPIAIAGARAEIRRAVQVRIS